MRSSALQEGADIGGWVRVSARQGTYQRFRPPFPRPGGGLASVGHPCQGLVVKLKSHNPPGHWPGRGIGRRHSVVAGGTLRASCHSGSQDWGNGGPGPGAKEGPCLRGHTATPHTGSQVGVVHRHMSFTHMCMETGHRRSSQYSSHVHAHARARSHRAPYSVHTP